MAPHLLSGAAAAVTAGISWYWSPRLCRSSYGTHLRVVWSLNLALCCCAYLRQTTSTFPFRLCVCCTCAAYTVRSNNQLRIELLYIRLLDWRPYNSTHYVQVRVVCCFLHRLSVVSAVTSPSLPSSRLSRSHFSLRQHVNMIKIFSKDLIF